MVSTRASSDIVALPPASSSSTRSGGSSSAPPSSAHVQRVFLLDLPMELLDKIFSYIGYKKVSHIRSVSRQMNQVCSLVLNSTFQKLQNQIMIRFQNVKAKMPRRESARRNHPLACECDIIETCHMRLSLLQMTFGKHIERKHCCFFPGAILDEVLSVLNHIEVTQVLGRPYKVTDELFDLSTMAMEYFKEHIEPGLPDLVYFSNNYLDFSSSSKQNFLESSATSSRDTFSSAQPSQMVLRKGIRKIKQGMKKYNNQLTVLRNELRSCKKKATEQSKQIAEQQKLIADQQKQTMDYASRLDENDKKNEEMSRKFSSLLQELNKCKTELQYWRSTPAPFPATCSACGHSTPVTHLFPAIVSTDLNPGAVVVREEVSMPPSLALTAARGVAAGSGSVGSLLKRKANDGAPTGDEVEASNMGSFHGNSSNSAIAEEVIPTTVTTVVAKKARRVAKTAKAT